MKRLYIHVLVAIMLLLVASPIAAQQLPNSNFEDWSAAAFDGNPQPKDWNASNVTQFGFKFNFAHREAGRNGGYSMMVQDQDVGAAGITETSPGYFALGQPWVYISSLTAVSQATAGTAGGIQWTHRPDTMSVWIKRTGNNVDKEDFYLLYYAWSGTAIGDKYKGKNGSCTSVTKENEESDVRQALNGNECGTRQKANQVAEGMWREKKTYGEWTNIRVPIYYMNNTVPEMLNVIFSASNYPNFRANSGLYAGNSLYVDDVELIYSSKIQKLYINDDEWKGFDPDNTSGIQTYALGNNASFPKIEAKRGAGSITNASGKTVAFVGRVLSGNEISIVEGDLESKPTTITVKAEDGKQTTYKVQFTKAASTNAKLANIGYVFGTDTTWLSDFNPAKYNYTVSLPYGTTNVPTIIAEGQEAKQKVAVTQASSLSGKATILVTAADNKTTQTYTLQFSIAALADNTLKDILVNGSSIPGFSPSQTTYKVSLPVDQATKMPTVTWVSAYPAGEQTIVLTMPQSVADLDGGAAYIKVTTPGNQVAKTYKLNFKIEESSYTYLADLKVVGDQVLKANPAKLDDPTAIAFAPDNMTYYVNLKMGTTTLPNILWTPGDKYQTITRTPEGNDNVDATVRITVTAGNKTDQSVYKLVFNTEKSEISTLAGIKINGVDLAGFRPDSTTYTYELPAGTTQLPTIEPIKGDEYQDTTVMRAGVRGTTRITVTAGNGNTTVYLITFTVAPYTDNTLKMINVGGEPLAGFIPEVNEYNYALGKGVTELPEVSYEKQDEKLQTVTVRSGGVNGDYRITVRPQDGVSRTYIIHFRVETSNNTKLKNLSVAGYELNPAFDPEIEEYRVTLNDGIIPAITYVKAEAAQRVLSVQENDTTQLITVTAESGDKRTYRIYFHIQLSENAYLRMIYLDSVPLAAFDSAKTYYEVQLTKATCPEVTVLKNPGQQVTITTPVGAGTAVILVAPENGSTQRYTIKFISQDEATVLLKSITLDGVAFAEFDPSKTDYSKTYTHALPVIGYTADSTLTVNTLWNGETVYLQVSNAKLVKTYSIAFTRVKDTKTQLAAIMADGDTLSDFTPAKYHYAYTLPAGSSYPALTYGKGDPSQTVLFGQTGEGAWRWLVTAENGIDTTSYSVHYTVAPYQDTTLADMNLIGLPSEQTFTFVPTTFDYSGFVLDEGAALPDVSVVPRPGQKVMCYNANDTAQHILVSAENGAQAKYTIRYTRHLSNNALLNGILIDGVQLASFTPDVRNYTYTLPRGTKAMPNVFPVGQLDNQTITTYVGQPNDTTRIHVEAQDGTTTDYLVAFPVEKCTNTKLGKLVIDGVARDVNTMEYVFDMPLGSTEPYDITFQKAEDEQLIEFVSAPISGVTRIIVTDETGDSRTYSIRYNVAEPQGVNAIPRVVYEYTTAASVVVVDSLTPQAGNNVIELPYGAKSFSVTRYDKSFDEQSVIFYDGGIRRGATIIACANRSGEEDVTYTITPHMPDFDTKGKLKDLKFKGTTIPNFRPDVYNYMVNVTTEPTKTNFTGIAYEEGKSVNKSNIDKQKKQITLTVEGGETYSVCWYYTNYEKLLDFSGDWVPVSQGVGYKPSSLWTVPGDCSDGYTWSIPLVVNLTYTTGKEVTPGGTNGVMLSTLRGAPMNGSVPGMMTLGTMAVNLTSNGNSTSSVEKGANVGAEYKNTPEALAFLVKPLSTSNITNWNLWLTLSDGSNYQESTYSSDFSNLNQWDEVNVPITLPTNAVSKFNIMLSSCDQENANQFGGSTIYESSVMYDNIHFVYNSELTGVKVDGVAAVKSDNIFTRNVSNDYVGLPELKFTGKVHDQMQVIEWLNGGEWVNGELTAKVTNYGENSQNATVYSVILKRAAVTSLNYTIDFGTYATTVSGDTTFIALPYGKKNLPKTINIIPASIHQRFNVAKNGNTVKVTVTAENGASQTKIYIFRETRTDNLDLQWGDKEYYPVYDKTIDETKYLYSVTANELPEIYFQKGDIGQTVDLKYTKDSATLVVTAPNGSATRTYTLRRVNPAVTTSGQIETFYLGADEMNDFGGVSYACTYPKPTQTIKYVLKDKQDSVVFVQAQTKMEWRVFGTVNHVYTYTISTPKNVHLAKIRINGSDYDEFDPNVHTYDISANADMQIELVPAEMRQTLSTVQEIDSMGTTYTTTVQVADTAATYRLRVARQKSANNSLAAILVDGKPLAGFNPDTLVYTITLPSPDVKLEQPQMPSISCVAGQKAQQIAIENGQLNGDPTLIMVTAEQGGLPRDYKLKVQAEPSHNAELTGIMVNGVAVEHFEPGRHYYSQEVYSDSIEIVPASDDRFQTVQIFKSGTTYTLHVIAEDSVTSLDYNVDVFVQNPSNDATLSNILLDGEDFTKYLHLLNPLLVFEPQQNTYHINIPSGATTLPEITAQLKMDGQKVDIKKTGMIVTITVTAVDNKSTNDYTLSFEAPKSKDARLSMIFLNGDSIPDFDPDYNFYQVQLPVGAHQMPEVVGQKGESHQTVYEAEMDTTLLQAKITVKAEDPYTLPNYYYVAFHLTKSSADTLRMIYQDGDSLATFDPQTFFYNDSLRVGTTAFPEISWDEADEWQTIKLDTVLCNESNLIRQITVIAENGKSNTYTVSYTIRKSAVDTLQMIYVDKRELPGFKADQNEYIYTLNAAHAKELGGALPEIEYIAGDPYQTVLVSQAPDSLSGKSLGYKSLITVTAAAGVTNTYTIHYPVELSSETTLNMIQLEGKSLSNFDSERFHYTQSIAVDASIPVVSVIKKEEAQTYEIYVFEDTVKIEVTAEDEHSKQTYTLIFERMLSNVTTLRDIILTDAQGDTLPAGLFAFRPERLEYLIVMPYNPEDVSFALPKIEYVLADSLQTVEIDTIQAENKNKTVILHVIAANGEDEGAYTLSFQFTRNNDAYLKSLAINEEPLANFNGLNTEYEYIHPYGTDSTELFANITVSYELSDSLATDTTWIDENGVIFIHVIAQDGVTELTYIVRQIIALDDDCMLQTITLDGAELADFDSEVTFYTYYLMEGVTPPEVMAEPRSPNAEVSVLPVPAGDTCMIICTAQDGSKRRYYIHFAISEINDAVTASSTDVLVKRIPGTSQLFVATIRKDVAFALYDQNGHLAFYKTVPPADPNDAEVYKDANGNDVLNDVSDTQSGLVVDIIPNQIFFYSFFVSDKKIVSTGKMIFH